MAIGNLLLWAVGGLVAYEAAIQLHEISERRACWDEALQYCRSVGKPLLRVGVRRGVFEPPNGDITLDIDPIVLNISGGVHGDERAMPFLDKEFGVCFNEHTLEHLYTAEDVRLAVRECVRVADYAVILTPSPWSLVGRLHPDHRLLLHLNDDEIIVEQRSGVFTYQQRSDMVAQAVIYQGAAPRVHG